MGKDDRDKIVRINVLVPLSERDAFDLACRVGKPRTSMNWRIRELMRADSKGTTGVPKSEPPKRGGPPHSKTPATPKRRSPRPKPRK